MPKKSMRREPVIVKSSKSWLTTAALLPSFIFLGYASWRLWAYTLDDAYISLEYAKNLAEGRGLVFNPGERVEGFSNPLWVFLLFALGVAGAPWVFTMKTLGFICATLTLGILASTTNDLVRRTPLNSGRKRAKAKGKRRSRKQKSAKDPKDTLTGDRALPWLFILIPTLLTVTHAGMAYYTVAGLETPLFMLLLSLAAAHQLKTEAVGRHGSRVYIPLSALALTRPEGIIFIPVFFCRRIWVAHRQRQAPEDSAAGTEHGMPASPIREVAIAGLACLPLAAYTLFRLAYFGDIFPNTYYAKPGTLLPFSLSSLEYAWAFIMGHGPLLATLLLALSAISLIGSPIRSQARFLAGILGAYTLFIVYTGGDWMAQHRLFQPLLPLLYLLPLIGLLGLPKSWSTGLAIVLLCVTLGHARHAPQFWRDLEENSVYDHAHRSDRNVEAALWLRDATSAGELIVTDEIGALGFYSDLHIVDQLGLIDKSVARILHDEGFNPYNSAPFSEQRRRVQRKMAEEVMRRHPRYVIIDYFALPPSEDSPFSSDLINPVTMRELYAQMGTDYEDIKSFSLMTNPPKTFVVFERRKEGA